jgi:hypothetical protein
MRRNDVPQNLMLDSGFWIGLYDTSDEHHERAVELALYFDYGFYPFYWCRNRYSHTSPSL